MSSTRTETQTSVDELQKKLQKIKEYIQGTQQTLRFPGGIVPRYMLQNTLESYIQEKASLEEQIETLKKTHTDPVLTPDRLTLQQNSLFGGRASPEPQSNQIVEDSRPALGK